MQKAIHDINILFPLQWDPDSMIHSGSLEPFDPGVIDFLDELSRKLNHDPLARAYPDVITFAFFCRKANLTRIRKEFFDEQKLRLGRGLVFHIAPSNVPVNFAYSLISGLLAGNGNIVRVPSQPFQQVDIICKAISEIHQTGIFNRITSRIALVRYEKSSDATAYFSSICDIRVIWGGDDTISAIRKFQLPPRSFDITFADRYSLCIINADKYINASGKEQLVTGFYNDTYLFDQNACTSPHLVVWTGSDDNVRESRKIFWDLLKSVIKQKQYVLQPVSAVDKLTVFFSQAIESEGIQKADFNDNLIWVNELKTLPANVEDFRCAGGYFNDYHAASIYDIVPVINRKYQTLSYFGFDYAELADFMKSTSPSGIDRIVPIGKTTDFSLFWDGYDLIRTLSRIIDIS